MKFLIFLLFIINTSYADILVLNLNGNNSTVKAAREAAKSRGEVSYVFPKSGDFLDAESLRKHLKALEQKNVDISSIVFSGHDGGGHFSGDTGSIGKGEMQSIVDEFPKLKESVKSIILRGCYTATPYEVLEKDDNSWRGMFPNINLLAGYFDGAPSSEKKESTSFVKEALELESKIYLEESVKNIGDMLSGISNSRWTTNAFAFRTCHDQEFRYTERQLSAEGYLPMNKEEIEKLCSYDDIRGAIEVASNYFYAEKNGFENPPLEHRGTDLREAYSLLNHKKHCIKLLDLYLTPSLQSQIRLIYFDYIKSNFLNQFGDKIKELEGIIAWYNSLSKDKIPLPLDIEKMSRKEIMSLVHKLTGIVYKDYIDVNTPTFGMIYRDDERIFKMSQTTSFMQSILVNLDEEIVPFDWVSSKSSSKEVEDFYYHSFENDYQPYSYEEQSMDGESTISDDSNFNDDYELSGSNESPNEFYAREAGENILYGSLGHYFNNKDMVSAELQRAGITNYLSTNNMTEEFFWGAGTNSFRLTQINNFLKNNLEVDPMSVIHTAVINPQFVSNELMISAIKKLKENKYNLTEMDMEKFRDSHISEYTENIKEVKLAQKKNFDLFVKEFMPEKSEELIDFFE